MQNEKTFNITANTSTKLTHTLLKELREQGAKHEPQQFSNSAIQMMAFLKNRRHGGHPSIMSDRAFFGK
jgi:hypothetical protein